LISGNDPKAKGGPFRDTKAAASYQEALAFMGFARREGESDHEVLVHSIVQDVEYLRNHPLIKPSIPVTGWLYDLHTGAVEKIEC
jgi:carbonic anhydrase